MMHSLALSIPKKVINKQSINHKVNLLEALELIHDLNQGQVATFDEGIDVSDLYSHQEVFIIMQRIYHCSRKYMNRD